MSLRIVGWGPVPDEVVQQILAVGNFKQCDPFGTGKVMKKVENVSLCFSLIAIA